MILYSLDNKDMFSSDAVFLLKSFLSAVGYVYNCIPLGYGKPTIFN